jgi:hypothetical protein
MTTSPSNSDEPVFFGVDLASGFDHTAMLYWNAEDCFLRVVHLSREDLMQMEIAHFDHFRFVESPLKVPQLEEHMATRHIDSKSKLGRRLISPKVKSGGRRYRGGGEKELERGARSYMVASQTNGYPIVQTMSKKQFDLHVEYTEG